MRLANEQFHSVFAFIMSDECSVYVVPQLAGRIAGDVEELLLASEAGGQHPHAGRDDVPRDQPQQHTLPHRADLAFRR